MRMLYCFIWPNELSQHNLHDLVPMVTALLLSTVPGELTELLCIRTNQTFHHKFSVFECMKIAQSYAHVSSFVSHYPVLQNVNILLEGTFS